MQRITLDIGEAFQPVEDEMHDTFLLAFFKEATS